MKAENRLGGRRRGPQQELWMAQTREVIMETEVDWYQKPSGGKLIELGEELNEKEEGSEVENNVWGLNFPPCPLEPDKCTMKNNMKYMPQHKQN